MRRSNRGDLSGQVFGRNRVLARSHRTAQRHWYYKCQDIYDNSIHFVHDSDLVPLERSLYLNAKTRAKKKGVTFTITEADIQIPKFCPLLGLELIPSRGKPWDRSPTLDCIDNTRGYTPDNIWVVSFLGNTLKNAGTAEQHQEIALMVNAMEMLGTASFEQFQRRND